MMSDRHVGACPRGQNGDGSGVNDVCGDDANAPDGLCATTTFYRHVVVVVSHHERRREMNELCGICGRCVYGETSGGFEACLQGKKPRGDSSVVSGRCAEG